MFCISSYKLLGIVSLTDERFGKRAATEARQNFSVARFGFKNPGINNVSDPT